MQVLCAAFILSQTDAPGAKQLVDLQDAILQLLNFARVVSTDLLDAILQLLNFARVVSADFFYLCFEFLDFNSVSRFGLCKELAVEMLYLRKTFWNESIHPADGSGKQVGLARCITAGCSLCDSRFGW